jgi:hypothetical protein
MKPPSPTLVGALLAAIVVLVVAPLAQAGGDFVDLAVGSSRVWLVGEPGVRVIDARTGRTLASPHLVGAPYPLSVTLAGGAAWVASVENGYVSGTLTRIDTRSGKTRVLWRKPESSVQYLAAGAGSVWAFIGSAGTTRIARFTLAGKPRACFASTNKPDGCAHSAPADSGWADSSTTSPSATAPSGH